MKFFIFLFRKDFNLFSFSLSSSSSLHARAMRSVAPDKAYFAPCAAAVTASAPGCRVARTSIAARAAAPAQNRETASLLPSSSSSRQSTSTLSSSSLAARSPVPFPRRRGRLLVTAALRTEVRQLDQIECRRAQQKGDKRCESIRNFDLVSA